MYSKVETFGVVAVAVLVFAGFALVPCCSWAQGPGIPATDGPGGGAISSNSPKWRSFTDPKSDTFAKLMRYDSGLQASIAPRSDAEGSRDMLLSRYPYPIGDGGKAARNEFPAMEGSTGVSPLYSVDKFQKPMIYPYLPVDQFDFPVPWCLLQ